MNENTDDKIPSSDHSQEFGEKGKIRRSNEM